jgi:glycosyltransferase involved in cell wall biosynthesis
MLFMNPAGASPGRPSPLLVYEPRTEGHHLNWLRMITEDLLSAEVPVTLALDLRPEGQPKVREQLSGLLPADGWLNAREESHFKLTALARCLAKSGAANVFLCAFDEIASSVCRRAAFGILPPAELRGRMGGIYHRPRFLVAPRWSPNRWLKQLGFHRLVRHEYFRQLLFLDEYLTADLQTAWPQAPFSFLPGPCPPAYQGARTAARQQLNLPNHSCVFLFYGGAYRRKGLHLVVRALLELPVETPAFLLCAGQQDPSADTTQGLQQLIRQNRACMLNHDHIPLAEERACFIGSDFVLLPYINHFGTSDVLLRAIAASKPVIVSNEQLLGRLAREHGLGLVFPSGDVPALRECIRQAAALPPGQIAGFSAATRRCAQRFSRENYRHALLKSLGVLPAPSPNLC